MSEWGEKWLFVNDESFIYFTSRFATSDWWWHPISPSIHPSIQQRQQPHEWEKERKVNELSAGRKIIVVWNARDEMMVVLFNSSSKLSLCECVFTAVRWMPSNSMFAITHSLTLQPGTDAAAAESLLINEQTKAFRDIFTFTTRTYLSYLSSHPLQGGEKYCVVQEHSILILHKVVCLRTGGRFDTPKKPLLTHFFWIWSSSFMFSPPKSLVCINDFRDGPTHSEQTKPSNIYTSVQIWIG